MGPALSIFSLWSMLWGENSLGGEMIVQSSELIARFLNRQRAPGYFSPTDKPRPGHGAFCGSRKPASVARLRGQFGLLVIFPLLVMPVDAGVYKWTDESGQVHYTDQYQEGSESVDLPEPSVYKPVPVPGAAESPAAGAEAAATGDYDVLEVAAPVQDETIRSNEGKVTVSLRLEPTLRQGDMIEVILDGEKRGELRSAGGTLSGVNRGTHSLKVRVVDASGQELISSEAVNFHLRRESKLFPQRQKPTPLPAGTP